MLRLFRVLLAGAVLALPISALAADPPAGNYKLIVPLYDSVWLVKFESKDGKSVGTVLDSTLKTASKTVIEGVVVDKDLLHFTCDVGGSAFAFEGRLVKDKDAKILGSASQRGNVAPAILEPTSLTTLDPFEQNREFLAKNDGGIEVVQVALACLQMAETKRIKTAEVKSWAEKASKGAEAYGPLWQRTIQLDIAEILNEQEGFAALALEYAQKLEPTLTAKDRSTFQKRVLVALADALERTGKKTEAKTYYDRAEKLPFIDVTKFTGRKGASDRVILVELFTGTQCLPCVASDKAFDGLLESYKPSEVVLLQYHLHIPGPDPLTSPDAEKREKFYRRQVRSSTPVILFNGGAGPAAGGKSLVDSQNRYEEFSAILNAQLEKPTKARLMASAKRKDNTIDIKIDVADLPETGRDVRLRVALVEEEVAYVGRNKLPVHHQVVRAFVGDGVDGTVMDQKSTSKTMTVDVEKVRKDLRAYLDKQSDMMTFPNRDRPLDLKKLRVVAFVQNDETGEVLNAVQADVKE